MPNTIFLPLDADSAFSASASGIVLTWTPSAQRLDVYGWYDHHVGLRGDSLTLRQLFKLLGITESDTRRAFHAKPCGMCNGAGTVKRFKGVDNIPDFFESGTVPDRPSMPEQVTATCPKCHGRRY